MILPRVSLLLEREPGIRRGSSEGAVMGSELVGSSLRGTLNGEGARSRWVYKQSYHALFMGFFKSFHLICLLLETIMPKSPPSRFGFISFSSQLRQCFLCYCKTGFLAANKLLIRSSALLLNLLHLRNPWAIPHNRKMGSSRPQTKPYLCPKGKRTEMD